MPLLRGRREEARPTRYRMQEKLFAIGDDFWIENDRGERAFKVERKGASGTRHAGAPVASRG